MTVPPQGGAKAAGIARRFCCSCEPREKRPATPFLTKKGTAAYIFYVQPPGARRFAGGSARDNEALARRKNPAADEWLRRRRREVPRRANGKGCRSSLPENISGQEDRNAGRGPRRSRRPRRGRPSARPSGRLRGRGPNKARGASSAPRAVNVTKSIQL